MYGYDDTDAYLVDTFQQGCLVETSLESLAKARSEKGPMASKNLSFSLRKTDDSFDLGSAVKTSLRQNAAAFLNPPIKNLGVKGILRASQELPNWFDRSQDVERDFTTTAMIMERAGTGGALFRNLYRDFLQESLDLLGISSIALAHELYIEAALHWTEVSNLLEQAGTSKDVGYIHQASELLGVIATKEKQAMIHLLNV